jgi:hypothetical protein
MIRRLLFAVVLGTFIGAATSYGQEHLGPHWQALANAASPWLVGAFAAGTVMHERSWAERAGLLACVMEVLSYYVITPLRGYPVTHREMAFWGLCAIVGGPLFGLAGWAWRHGSDQVQAIGAAALPATFLAEAIGTYGLRLHYRGAAALFAGIGVLLAVLVAIWLPKRWYLVVPLITVTLAGIFVYGWLLHDATTVVFS